MNDAFEDHFADWSRIMDALTRAFFYDNLLPIEDIDREFTSVLIDIRQWLTLSQKATKEPLSAKEKAKQDQLLPKKSAERIEKLIDKLEELSNFRHDENHQVNQVIDKLKRSSRRAQWHQEQQQAKVDALADAENSCRRLLNEIRSICIDDGKQI